MGIAAKVVRLGVFGLAVIATIPHSHVAAQDKSWASVVRVLDECSLEVRIEGRLEAISIAMLADEKALRKALLSSGDAPPTNGMVGREEIELFLEHRAMAANFLRCLVPTNAQVQLVNVRRTKAGFAVAEVRYLPSKNRDGILVLLQHEMLSEGYAMPDVVIWGTKPRDPPVTSEDICASYFFGAKNQGYGVWGIGRLRELPRVSPELLVPLLSVSCDSIGNDDGQGRIRAIIVCATRRDVHAVCANASWIRSIVRECAEADTASSTAPDDRASQIEAALLARLSKSQEWNGASPKIIRVLVHIDSVPSGD